MLNRGFFNDNISDADKDILITEINKITSYFQKYDVELDLNNSGQLFEKLNFITEVTDKDFVVKYDEYTNTLTQNLGSSNFTVQRYEGELVNALLEIVSRKYNFEKGKYDRGLMCKGSDSVYHGLQLNDMFRKYLTTIITGYTKEESVKDFYFDSQYDYLTLPDRVIYDLTSIYGSEFIINSFVNGNGQDLYYKISNMLGDEESAVMFYNSIDSYNSNRIANRAIYDTSISELKEKQEINLPKM